MRGIHGESSRRVAVTVGRAVASAALVLAGLGAGCKQTPRAEETPAPVDTGVPFEQAWESLRARQEHRRERLSPMTASGQVELRWRDDDGSHFEYCKGELFIRLPSETALNLTKVGERFLWLGEDGTERWMFDLRSRDNSVLWIVDAEASGPMEGAAAGGAPLLASQVSLIDLLGLMELPPAGELDAVHEDRSSVLDVEFAGRGGPIRARIDTATGLPLRLVMLDAEGQPFLTAELAEYESLERGGLAPGDQAKFPTRVTITSGEEGREAKLFLNPEPGGEERVKDRLFQLETLQGSMKPRRVERR